MSKSVERKVRSDKKIDVKPTCEIQLYNCVSNIADLTGMSMQHVAEHMCVEGMKSNIVVEHISEYFVREIFYRNTLYRPKRDFLGKQRKKRSSLSKRVSIRFSQEWHQILYEFSIALGVSVSESARIMLAGSIRNSNIVKEYINTYVKQPMNQRQKVFLSEILQFIKKENPYKDDFSFKDLLGYLKDEIMDWWKDERRD